MKVLTPFLLSFLLVVGIISCDDHALSERDSFNSPAVTSLSIQPTNISFTPADGFKDTTIILTVNASIENPDLINDSGYILRDRSSGSIFTAGNLSPVGGGSGTFSATVPLETSTTSFDQYQLEVYAFDEQGFGNYANKAVSISGFNNAKPVIESTESPSVIVRPQTGAVPATFTATVSDADGDETIQEVRIRIIDQVAGEVSGSPFLMLDDGNNFGDVTAGDHTYTLSFNVTPTSERPDRDYNIEFFAVDRGGLYSDTVRTTFSIRDN